MVDAQLEDKYQNQLICSVHPGNQISFFQIDQTNIDLKAEQIMKCQLCINEQDINLKSLIPISLILSADDSLIFSEYPFQDKKVPTKIKDVNKFDAKAGLTEVNCFFKKVRSEFLAKLDQIEYNIEQRYNQIPDIISSINQLYNESSQKFVLKNILSNQKISAEEKTEEILRAFGLVINQNGNLDKFEDLFTRFYFNKSIVDCSQVISKRMHLNLVRSCENLDNQFKREISSLNDYQINQLKTSSQLASIKRYLSKNLIKETEDNLQKFREVQQNLSHVEIKVDNDEEQEKSIAEMCQNVLKHIQIEKFLQYIPKIEINKVHLPLNFERTKYQSSQQIITRKDEKGINLSMKGDKKNGQSVSCLLDNQKSYVVKTYFSKPIGKLQQENIVAIGLIRNQDIDSNYVLAPNTKSGYASFLDREVSVIKKGQQIGNSTIRNSLQSLEFRFCIKNKKFIFADSGYNNINEVDGNLFETNLQYRFGVYFQNIIDDFEVSITEFAELEEEYLDKF